MRIDGRMLRLIDGAPDISRLPYDRLLASDGSEYMRRYYTKTPKGQHARFHKFLASDPQIDLHDHPWDFASYLLTGSYVEYTPDGVTEYKAPCLILRKAEQFHRLELPNGPVWTYVILGRFKRTWGFRTDSGWVPWTEYADKGTIARCDSDRPTRRSGERRKIPVWLVSGLQGALNATTVNS